MDGADKFPMCTFHACSPVIKRNVEHMYSDLGLGELKQFFSGMFDQRQRRSALRWMMEVNYHMRVHNIYMIPDNNITKSYALSFESY